MKQINHCLYSLINRGDAVFQSCQSPLQASMVTCRWPPIIVWLRNCGGVLGVFRADSIQDALHYTVKLHRRVI